MDIVTLAMLVMGPDVVYYSYYGDRRLVAACASTGNDDAVDRALSDR